uniref:Uncharacterized protein n=1 Tax=Podospora anserina (strain S / ATCC MYA-4624 / DSM 980 / FGSC 10383) TaxID=515849 RepID=A0A090CX43_PODAN|nr:Putative protein of unknown function [Podospora anserina S mat+]
MPRQEQEKWRPRLEVDKYDDDKKQKTTGGEGQLEGDDSFQAGDWWLSMACARRDGMVGTEEERVSQGRYNVYTLPLLSGREEDIGGHGNRSKYVRTGGLKEMHVKLITLVGKEVRVLRGYLLRSGIAPGVGVRFDGIWKLASYRHKLDLGTGEYKLELGLERVANGQRAMREVLKVPRPSQMDEWDLFEKLEADKVRQVQGESASYAWRMQREEARVEREMWKRAHRFRESICSLGSGGSFVEGLGMMMRKRSEVVLKTALPAPPGKVKGGGDEVRKKVRMDSRASTVVYDVSTGEAWEEGEEEGVKRSSTRISWEDVLNDALEIAKGSVGEWGPGGGGSVDAGEV